MGTSPEFRTWVETALSAITGETDERELNATLFDAEMMKQYPDSWAPPF